MTPKPRSVLLALGAVVSLVAAATAAAQAPAAGWPRKEFCGRAQSYLAGSSVRVTNTVHDNIESFQRNAPIAQPLTTQQFDVPDDRDPKAARLIACKLLTADRIQAVYGAQGKAKQGACEQVNRYTYQSVLASLSPQEREGALFGKGKKVLMDRDATVATAAEFYAPFEAFRVEKNGRLRIGAKSLRADWADPNNASLPEDARGVHFCTFVAPEYMRRLLLDASIVLPGPPPK
jgi:hypothetical protein